MNFFCRRNVCVFSFSYGMWLGAAGVLIIFTNHYLLSLALIVLAAIYYSLIEKKQEK